ncbi:hypothetical protein HMPREF9536_03672 [Escherichia coli MS 84-1]|nr:hypothetical protein HMPREF9536_03672 [Escherichia coli MS 84-1]
MAEVPSAGRPDAGTSGSTTTSAVRCSASREAVPRPGQLL